MQIEYILIIQLLYITYWWWCFMEVIHEQIYSSRKSLLINILLKQRRNHDKNEMVIGKSNKIFIKNVNLA